MRKILIMVMLAFGTFAAYAQDTKQYEDKMKGLETQYQSLIAAYKTIKSKDKSAITADDNKKLEEIEAKAGELDSPVSYTHLTLPTTCTRCRYRWSPYH